MTNNKHLTATHNVNTRGRLLGDIISGTEGTRRGTAGHGSQRSRQDRRGHFPRRPTYYFVRQAAWLLGVPTSVIHRAIRLGTLPTIRRNGHLVVTEDNVRRLMLGGAA